MQGQSGRSRLAQLVREARGQGLLRAVALGAAGSGLVKVANSFLGIAVAIVLARTLGPEGFGTYASVFALVSTLAIPAQFGVLSLLAPDLQNQLVDQILLGGKIQKQRPGRRAGFFGNRSG